FRSTATSSRTAMTPPISPASDRAMERTRDDLDSRAATSASNRAESGKAGVWANRRSMAGSNSSADMRCAPVSKRFRLEPEPKFIQTTLDMRFHRSERQIHGRRDFRVRQAGAVAQGNAQALDFVQRFQRFIQVHPANAVDDGSRL